MWWNWILCILFFIQAIFAFSLIWNLNNRIDDIESSVNDLDISVTENLKSNIKIIDYVHDINDSQLYIIDFISSYLESGRLFDEYPKGVEK